MTITEPSIDADLRAPVVHELDVRHLSGAIGSVIRGLQDVDRVEQERKLGLVIRPWKVELRPLNG